MRIDIVSLFPEMFSGPFAESMVKRAIIKKALTVKIHQLRRWAVDKRGSVDDRPYGGGPGMLIRPEPLFQAVTAIKKAVGKKTTKVILLDARGKTYNQEMARQLVITEHIILICGHYEGVDYRVQKYLADEVISIGNYILTGGEIPAMVIVDSLARLLPGVLGNQESTKSESFSDNGNLEYPQYTRPETYRGHKVPAVLLSGNPKQITAWQQLQRFSPAGENLRLQPRALKRSLKRS